MTEHELKTWPDMFDAVSDERKRYEIRKDDRGFAVGDILYLREYYPDTKIYSGRWIYAQVTYITKNFPGLQEGYVVMGIKITRRN
jgi:hypothetical protein